MQTDREELSPKAKARRAPHTPGVYLMKDAAGLVVYVGKAKDLKKRLASYFVPRQRMTPKVAAMMDTVADMEWHEVRSETEALLLEGKLIKRWRPRWNILFRDDKQFPQVRVDLADHTREAVAGVSLYFVDIAPIASNRFDSVQSSSSQPPAKTMSCLPHWIISAALPMQWFEVAQADEIE